MSVEIHARIICDGCRTVVRGKVGRKTTTAWESYVSAARYAESAGWIRLLQFGPARDYCKVCADKPMPKAKPVNYGIT